MKRTIELDKEDIRKAIASAYNVQPKDVKLELFMTMTGYGTSEREIPDVSATISVDSSVRKEGDGK